MTVPEVGVLYALVDPRDQAVRYVGQTTRPLAVRLAGHLTNPAPRVGTWLRELNEHGVLPDIVPLQESVPAASLAAVERAEITRRLLNGDELLNEQGTAEARAVLWERRVAAEAEQERADWMRMAEIAREALGGPLSPGDLPLLSTPAEALVAHRAVLALAATPELPRRPGDDNWMSKATHLMIARGRAKDELWNRIRGAWGHLRGRAGKSFDFHLEAAVTSAVGEPWSDDADIDRYITLIPWGMIAVAPWASIAARGGMRIDSPEFIDWVSDDAEVRDALELLLIEAGDRLGRLDVLDEHDREVRPSMMLAVMTAAHCGIELPDSMKTEARRLLLSLARDKQLTEPMARLLAALDPKAMDSAYGPNLAAEIDARLAVAPGTARRVLVALLEDPRSGHLGKLSDIVTRAEKAIPTVPAPDYHTWTWDIGPMVQAATANFVAAGLMPAPRGLTEESFLEETHSLWAVWRRWTER